MRAIALGLVAAILLAGCAKKAPDCNEKRTKDLVIEISKEEINKQLKMLYDPKTVEIMNQAVLEVVNVRTTNFNKETGTYECAADLKITGTKGTNNLPITYISELADGGKNFYVSVKGL